MGSPSASGWQLHHRPVQDPSNYLAEDTRITDDAIIDYPVPRALIPDAKRGLPTQPAPLSILTCPDGTCVASPVSSECKTVYDYEPMPGALPPVRIAVVGDELVRDSETCRGTPEAPDYCALSLEQTMREWGYSTWISYHEGNDSYAWLNVVREKATTRPDVMVIAVAAHEARRLAAVPLDQLAAERDITRQSFDASIRATRAANPGAGIVLVTTTERGTPGFQTEATLLNRMIWKIFEDSKAKGNLFVAGWEALVTSLCGEAWVERGAAPCEYFDNDQLHLRGAGDALRNSVIIWTVAHTLKPDN
ncbi:MAG TPA: hypothetical protein VI072_13615 [Polyangiaceae bacterium]